MTDEESWAKKPVLLHRQRQLDEINDLLEGMLRGCRCQQRDLSSLQIVLPKIR